MTITRTMVDLNNGRPACPGWKLASEAMAVTLASYGAHVASVKLRDGRGPAEVTVGYQGTADGYHGATIGRVANRVWPASIMIDGHLHELITNEGDVQLHGGPNSIETHVWSGSSVETSDGGVVTLSTRSMDGANGYPGTADISARFELNAARLTISYSAMTTAPTPINIANHTYWNLGEPSTLLDHHLQVCARRVVMVDDRLVPVSGPPATVDGTRFDLRSGTSLGATHPPQTAHFDHCFVLDNDRPDQIRLSHRNGRRLVISTDQDGVQVYTGAHLQPGIGAVALETHGLPNMPNRRDFGDCTLRPGERWSSTTTYDFGSTTTADDECQD